MKTLYISDLDGTLLNPDAELSHSTAEKLNRLIGQGADFTAATARTWATVSFLLQEVHLKLPVILMNGVCLYDPKEQRYLHTAHIQEAASARLIAAMKEAGVQGFLYKIIDGELVTCYEALATKGMRDFKEERERKYNKIFTKVRDLAEAADADVIYFSLMDTKERLDPVYAAASRDPELHTEYYQDIYDGSFWYLEMSAGGSSKAASVRWMKEHYGYDRLVVFGDNLNDLPMFAEADEKYAVANAVGAVKEAADAVIGANTEDGVPEFMKGHLHGLL